MSFGNDTVRKKEGSGRKTQIKPDTFKAGRLMGDFFCGLGVRRAATKINKLGVFPDKKPIGKLTVTRSYKNTFGVVWDKCRIMKTRSLDNKYAWEKTRITIMI